MKRTVRIVLVLLLVSGAAGVALAEDTLEWPSLAPELWNENQLPQIVHLALKGNEERGPIEPPPVVPPGKKIKPIRPAGINPATPLNHVESISTPGNLDASGAQAIPGSRARSFMSEHRLAERSLKGTIKRLG